MPTTAAPVTYTDDVDDVDYHPIADERAGEVAEYVGQRALRESVHKWDSVLYGTSSDRGASNCPCCTAFLVGGGVGAGDNCADCPIAMFTGKTHCAHTPYRDWITHHSEAHGFRTPRRASLPGEKPDSDHEGLATVGGRISPGYVCDWYYAFEDEAGTGDRSLALHPGCDECKRLARRERDFLGDLLAYKCEGQDMTKLLRRYKPLRQRRVKSTCCRPHRRRRIASEIEEALTRAGFSESTEEEIVRAGISPRWCPLISGDYLVSSGPHAVVVMPRLTRLLPRGARRRVIFIRQRFFHTFRPSLDGPDAHTLGTLIQTVRRGLESIRDRDAKVVSMTDTDSEAMALFPVLVAGYYRKNHDDVAPFHDDDDGDASFVDPFDPLSEDADVFEDGSPTGRYDPACEL